MTKWNVEYAGFLGRVRRVFMDKNRAFQWVEQCGIRNYVIYRGDK